MNLADQQLLMQLYDGELPPEQATWMEQRLGEDAEVASVFEGLLQLSEVVRGVATRRESAADDIAERVMARIEAEASTRPALRVLEGGGQTQPAAMPEPTRPATGSA